MAELYIASDLKPPVARPPQTRDERSVPAPVSLSENDLKSYTVEFESRELNAIYRFAAESGVLSIQPGDGRVVRLRSLGPDRMRPDPRADLDRMRAGKPRRARMVAPMASRR